MAAAEVHWKEKSNPIVFRIVCIQEKLLELILKAAPLYYCFIICGMEDFYSS